MKKKAISILLALSMIVSLFSGLPVAASAEGGTTVSTIKAALTFDRIKNSNVAPYAINGDLFLPSRASYDAGNSTVSFSSSDGVFEISWNTTNSAIADDGKVTQSSQPVTGTLTATIHDSTPGSTVNDEVVTFSLTVLQSNYSGIIDNQKQCEILARNIGSGYLNNMDKTNYAWVVADLAAANDVGIYGNSDPNIAVSYSLTNEQKQTYVNYAIGVMAQDKVNSGDLAQNIIGMAALGYDARSLTTTAQTSLNAVDKLAAMVDQETNIYTLPYILIALQQFDTNDYQTKINALVNKIVNEPLEEGGWGYQYNGVDYFDADATSCAILALAPYYKQSGYDSVTAAIDNAKVAIKKNVGLNDRGTIVSPWGTNSAESTALLIMGLAAIGENPTNYFTSKNLVSGLLAMADVSGAGFKYDVSLSAFSTEQGFRGLIAAAGYAKNSSGYMLYHFVGSMIPAKATLAANCPVNFSVVPTGATIEVKDSGSKLVNPTPVSGSYDLPAGNYTYVVSKSGYVSKPGSFTVSSEEASAHTSKGINVSLSASNPNIENKISVTVSVKTHDAKACNNSYTYLHNASAYSDLFKQSVSLNSGSTVFDALDAALTASGLSYRERSWGYIDAINGLSELDHGSKSGWMYRVNGVTATVSCRNYQLTSNDSVVWFFSDDYTNEYGSEQWSGTTLSKPVVATNTITAGNDGSASISAGDLAAVKESGGALSVETALGGIALTEKGTAALADMLEGNQKLSISVIKTDAGKSNFTVVSHDKAIVALDISIMAGTKDITEKFGTMTVSVDVGKSYANQTMGILHLKDDGKYEILTGKVDANGKLSFDTVSLSAFVVFSEGSVPVEYRFRDVENGSWYKDYVQYVYENGIMTGVSDTSFEPKTVMSRAMLVTVLYRMDGKKNVAGNSAFHDVSDPSAWYYDAVVWASKNGIIGGYGNGLFGPSDDITREQMVTIFHRFAKYKAYGTGATLDISGYSDIESVSEWSVEALRWAVGNGIISGTSGKTLSPSDRGSRCEAAAVIVRFLKNAPVAANELVNSAYSRTASYYLSNSLSPGYGSEWEVVGFCVGGYSLPTDWIKGYYNAVCKYVSDCEGVLSKRKYTEYSRVIFALVVAGYNATSVAGYDLTTALRDYETTVSQGINGPTWALIAMDKGQYVSDVRQKYVDYILNHELETGGWAISGTKADPDVTAMVLRALKNDRSNTKVAAAIERGIGALSRLQDSDGGYSSGGIANAESCAQVFSALCELGIRLDDARFVKNGILLQEKLLSYQLENGSFEHTKGSGTNPIATEQAFCALAIYKQVSK